MNGTHFALLTAAAAAAAEAHARASLNSSSRNALIFERSQLALLVPVSRGALLMRASAAVERSRSAPTGTISASKLRSKITKISITKIMPATEGTAEAGPGPLI